ncbi:hypothetical protein J5N97_015104 [Dioscorea zingiberensis]|uniref:Uncharacterized protein n=1 Tax=Dioscorea zingiberensis TaxID=325984 RepID=A0A9D5CWJ2_9LILI|nr:hypothetical protein J5N97_015104 [Dioscorea zingiberensis]
MPLHPPIPSLPLLKTSSSFPFPFSYLKPTQRDILTCSVPSPISLLSIRSKLVFSRHIMEIEEDVILAELSRQISLLIMDDNEEFPTQHPPPLPLPGFHQVGRVVMPSSLTYETSSYMRESKGTGVFIPRCKYTRRKNRSGRSNPSNMSSYRETNKSGTVLGPHVNSTERCIEAFKYCQSSAINQEHFTS